MGFVSQLSEMDYWCQGLSSLKGSLAKCGFYSHGCERANPVAVSVRTGVIVQGHSGEGLVAGGDTPQKRDNEHWGEGLGTLH